MVNPPRILVDAVRRYCAECNIALDMHAEGWLLVLDPHGRRHLIFGYDLGLNSAVAHRVASDKAATAELLALAGVSCAPHQLFMRPPFGASDAQESVRKLLEAHPAGLVVKPNEGTSGRDVARVADRRGLEQAMAALFAKEADVAISPFLVIDEEVRVVLLDDAPLIVYAKQRRGPEWRHNLEFGATPLLLDSGAIYDACAALAVAAARAIGIRFASIDLVCADGGWQVLEINSGVVMEALGKLHPERVHAAYHAALDRLFATRANE